MAGRLGLLLAACVVFGGTLLSRELALMLVGAVLLYSAVVVWLAPRM